MSASPCTLDDRTLVHRVKHLVVRSNAVTAELLAHLGEVDARRLYAPAGCPSMHAWCVSVLGLSDGSAYHHIRVARLARDFPAVLVEVAEGRQHLSGLVVLAPHLTVDNHAELLKRAAGRTRREIETMVADLAPKPDAPSAVRRLPRRTGPPLGFGGMAHRREEPNTQARGQNTTGLGPNSHAKPGAHPSQAGASSHQPGANSAQSGPRRSEPGTLVDQPAAPHHATPPLAARKAKAFLAERQPEPLGHHRYKVQFTANARLVERLREAQALLSHRLPGGDLDQVIELALDALCDKVRKERFAQGARPKKHASGHPTHAAPQTGPAQAPPAKTRAGTAKTGAGTPKPGPSAPKRPSRHIPNEVRRQVIARDGHRCAFVAPDGRRCEASRFLELHHRIPFAKHGAHTVDNVEFRCKAHNLLAAQEDFGAEHMARCITTPHPQADDGFA